MPILTDPATIRARLNRDRVWAAYAIGDLQPGFVEQCEWRGPKDDDGALMLVYHGFDPPIAFAMGESRRLGELFAELSTPTISLHLRADALAALTDVYAPIFTRPMRRMFVRPEAFVPTPHPAVKPIRESDLAAVLALYDEGHARGEGPTFFHAAMLRQSTFQGLWEHDALIAVAGTHLYSVELGVCAIGNVYTRSDRRGRGLAAAVTSAVVARAMADGVSTIVLNVGHDNGAARRVYERLGFDTYCDFVEGEATRTVRRTRE